MKNIIGKVLAATLAFCIGSVGVVSAQALPTPQPAYKICKVTTTTATICTGLNGIPAQFILGFVNNSASSQSATLTCYDNATAASGYIVETVAPLGATQVINMVLPGLPLTNGLTCQASAAITGDSIEVLIR